MANVQLKRLYHLPVMVYWTAPPVPSCLVTVRKGCTAGGRLHSKHAPFVVSERF